MREQFVGRKTKKGWSMRPKSRPGSRASPAGQGKYHRVKPAPQPKAEKKEKKARR